MSLKALPLTPFEERILHIVQRAGPNGCSVMHVASRLWPDAWEAAPKSHGYLCGHASQAAWRLKERGLLGSCCSAINPDRWSRSILFLSERAKANLARKPV